MPRATPSPVVFLSSITSDIGIALAQRYARDGYVVAGTYRSTELLPALQDIPGIHLFYCDLADVASIATSVADFKATGLQWDVFVSLASWPPPLRSFFDCPFDDWSFSVHVNAIEQLRVLHALYPLRHTEVECSAIFFAGPGTNNAVKDFSALTVSKIMLIKMCELLDAECADLNSFIVGPGWTRTKTHDLILADPHLTEAKRSETEAFLAKGDGTSMDDIYESMRWLSEAGRAVAGGRNFSIVHDCWGSDELRQQLMTDPDMYKLRRYGNLWKQRPKKS
jgi:NAD(P)-dependent dehydrogenase (short-subunit alcohol dehydrogenase family)